MPVVSIIVPVYKVEKYIGECIESLQKQTLKDIEILLIDDGSPDNSGAICDAYEKKDARITVIHQNNAGVSVARNAGLSKAKGDWILFVDGDDYAAEKMCEDAVNAASQHSADIVIFSYYTLNNNGTTALSKLVKENEGDISDKKEYIQKKIITQYYDREIASAKGVSAGTCWGKLVKSSVLRDSHVLFIPGLIRAQDTVFWLNVFEYTSSVYYLDKPLYYYRVTDTNITSGSRFIPDSEQKFNMLLQEYQSFIDSNEKDVEFVKAFRIRTLQVLLWSMEHNFFHPKNEMGVTEKLRHLRNLCRQSAYEAALRTKDYRNLPRGSALKVYLCKHHCYILCYIAHILITRRRTKRLSNNRDQHL